LINQQYQHIRKPGIQSGFFIFLAIILLYLNIILNHIFCRDHMKYALLFVVAFLALGASAAAQTGKLAVRMTNFAHNRGVVRLHLHNQAESFPTKPAESVRTDSADISGNQALVVFDDLPYGEYAIAVHHDEDGDGRVNTNLLGIPTEDMGVSNDAKGSFGPPKYEDAKFEFNKKEMVIKIRIQS
jgi:uncharacterized protein (DUF2141 family)